MQSILSYLTVAMAIDTGPLTEEPSRAYSINSAHDKGTSLETRSHWMRRANSALYDVTGSPCPSQAFGSVIVNHTAGGLGELVCMGANDIESGNPTLHGETAAIRNCSAILTDPNGPYKLSGHETLQAWADLTLYTNAEPCAMCAAAIRWSGFKEVVFGTSMQSLREYGWKIMSLPAEELFKYTTELPTGKTAIVGGVLANETDVFFKWQHARGSSCPPGCKTKGSTCTPEAG